MNRLLLAALAAATLLHAQGTTATIQGRVADPSGAVIAGADVTALSVNTNESRKVATLGDGSYTLQFLPIGKYNLTISSAGFRTFERKDLILEVGTNARIDATLEVGATGDQITVDATVAPMVETTAPTLGQVVTNTEINNLPLVNRDIYTLLSLTAGVDTSDAATDNFGAPMQVTIVNGAPIPASVPSTIRSAAAATPAASAAPAT